MFDIPLPAEAIGYQVNPLAVRLMLAEFQSRGGDPASLCSGLDFTLADLQCPGFRMSYDRASQAVRRVIMALQDPLLGLRIGMRHHVVSFGLVGFGAMAASTLQAAGALALRFQKEAGSLLVLDADLGPDHVAVLARPRFADVAIEAALVDGTYAALVCAARQILDTGFRPRAVELVARRPADTTLHQEVFQCPVRFGCERNRLVIENAWVNSKVARGDPVSLRRITSLLEVAATHCPKAPTMEALIERRLRDSIRRPPTLAELAKTVDMSERNLRRKLTEVGRSYGDMLDHLRKTHALELVARSRHTAREIAVELGFDDPRSLRRAFKRWTGKTLASAMAGVSSSSGADQQRTGSALADGRGAPAAHAKGRGP